MDTQPANRLWLPTQPRQYTTREKIPLSRQLLKMGTRWPETCWATYKEQLIRRNKYNTKWHLVGFLFHIELRCTVNHTSYFKITVVRDVAPCNPMGAKASVLHVASVFVVEYLLYPKDVGTAVSHWLSSCATNRKVSGLIPDGVIGIFHWHNPSDRTMALGSIQSLTEMSTRSISWG